MRELQRVLRAYFTKRIGRRDVVDDLVQNTLVRVHTSLDELNDTSRLKAFAMKGALFELQDYYRGRYSPKEQLVDEEDRYERTIPAGPPGAQIDVERALQVLSPKARRIIELREMGYLYREIAEMVDTSEAAVKMQVKRAFDKMKEALLLLLVALGALFSPSA